MLWKGKIKSGCSKQKIKWICCTQNISRNVIASIDSWIPVTTKCWSESIVIISKALPCQHVFIVAVLGTQSCSVAVIACCSCGTNAGYRALRTPNAAPSTIPSSMCRMLPQDCIIVPSLYWSTILFIAQSSWFAAIFSALYNCSLIHKQHFSAPVILLLVPMHQHQCVFLVAEI